MPEIDRFETLFGPMFHYVDDEVIGQSLRRYGQWALDEIALLWYVLSGSVSGNFVDFGANVGTHTVAIATLFPATRVLSFEANRAAFQLLCTNVTINGLANASVYNYLVSESTTMTRAVSNAQYIGKNLGAMAFQVVPVDSVPGSQMLQVALDDVLPADEFVSFIKADLEGMELNAIRGARATMRRCQPSLYFENGTQANAGPLFDELSDLGYETFWHINFPFDKENFRGDTVNIFGTSVEIGTLCIHRENSIVEEFRESLTPTTQIMDERAWHQCLALNARLRTDIKAKMTFGNKLAWLRSRLLKDLRSTIGPSADDRRPPLGGIMPTFAEVRRATLLDIPGDALRSLLTPYIEAASFDEAGYLQRNPDVAAAVVGQRLSSAHEHYVAVGYFEGRVG